MKSRDVVGRKIVAVKQTRVPADDVAGRTGFWHIDALVLDNGDEIHFTVVEQETGEYGLEGWIRKSGS